MRTTLHVVTTLLLLAGLPGQRSDRPQPAAPKLSSLTFTEANFRSEAVGRDVPYGVYLPTDYGADGNDRRYPLVIWLHGMWEDHLRFHHRGGAPLLDDAIAAGKLPPCIFVTANGGRTSMYLNHAGERWQDLITDDLLAHLEKTYRVSTGREQRAIMGVSMGGMAALRIAFTRPELFGTVATHSAAVFAEDPAQLPARLKQLASRIGLDEVFGDPIDKATWQAANPLCLARGTDAGNLRRLSIYFDAGTRDRMGLDQGNKALHDLLSEREVPHTFRLIDGGGHSWGDEFQFETLPHSFALVGRVFRGESAIPGDDAKGETPPKPATR